MRFSDDIVGDVGWRVLCVIVYRCVESRNRTKSTQIGDLVVKDQLRAILAGDTSCCRVLIYTKSRRGKKCMVRRKNRAGKKYPECRCRRLDGMLLFF